jgi:hypothetical protein
MIKRDIYPTSNFISHQLIHWTGRKKNEQEAFEVLKTILSNKELKFSSNTIAKIADAHGSSEISQKMICFTDIPIEHAYAIKERYGNIGIVFDKEKLMQYNARPVFYYTEEELLFDLSNIMSEGKYSEPKLFTENVQNLISYFQNYHSIHDHNTKSPYYNEREWRIIRKLPEFTKEQLQDDVWLSMRLKNDYQENPKLIGEVIFRNNNHFLKFNTDCIVGICCISSYVNQAEELLKELEIECQIVVFH